jgi:hypothetical protein
MTIYYSYSFEAPVDTLEYEPYTYTVIFLPPEIESALELSKHPRLRVEGEIADYPFNAAIIPSRQGRHIILSRDLLQAAGLRLGHIVEVRFNIADQDAVALPEELERALDANQQARDAWRALTPGRRRGLAHLVGKLKGADARNRKADALVDLLSKGGPLPGPPSRTAAKSKW